MHNSKTTTKTITVLAATSQEELENDGAAVENNHYETVKQAREAARQLVTDDFATDRDEDSTPLGYAQVLVNGECVADFFRKGAR